MKTSKQIERIRQENERKETLGTFDAVLFEARANKQEKEYEFNEWQKLRKLEWQDQKPILIRLAQKGNLKAQGILKQEKIAW